MTHDQERAFLVSSALALVVGVAFGYLLGLWDSARMGL